MKKKDPDTDKIKWKKFSVPNWESEDLLDGEEPDPKGFLPEAPSIDPKPKDMNALYESILGTLSMASKTLAHQGIEPRDT